MKPSHVCAFLFAWILRDIYYWVGTPKPAHTPSLMDGVSAILVVLVVWFLGLACGAELWRNK